MTLTPKDYATTDTTLGSATQGDREWVLNDAKWKRIKKVVMKFDASVTGTIEMVWRRGGKDWPIEKKTDTGTDWTWVPPVDAVDEGDSRDAFVAKFPQLTGRTVEGQVYWEG